MARRLAILIVNLDVLSDRVSLGFNHVYDMVIDGVVQDLFES